MNYTNAKGVVPQNKHKVKMGVLRTIGRKHSHIFNPRGHSLVRRLCGVDRRLRRHLALSFDRLYDRLSRIEELSALKDGNMANLYDSLTTCRKVASCWLVDKVGQRSRRSPELCAVGI